MQCNSKGRQVCYVPVGRHGIRLGRTEEGESGALGYLACLQFVLHVYFGLDGANGFCEYNIKVEIIPIQDMLENCLLMGQGGKGKKKQLPESRSWIGLRQAE